MTIDGACEFCRVHDEKLSHLFFEYQYSKDIWSRVLHHYGVLRSVQTWDGEVQWAAVKSRSTKERDRQCSMAFIEIVYAVWIQRNASLFRNHFDSVESVVTRIWFSIACRNQ